jgi:hypothetical protein
MCGVLVSHYKTQKRLLWYGWLFSAILSDSIVKNTYNIYLNSHKNSAIVTTTILSFLLKNKNKFINITKGLLKK